MGWLVSTMGSSRKEQIEHCTKGWTHNNEDGSQSEVKCIAHCWRGGSWAGVLWAVYERTFTKNGQGTAPAERFIACFMIRKYGEDWGRKDVCADSFDSCPISYFSLVPKPSDEGSEYGDTQKWRDQVIAKHNATTNKRRSLKKGTRVKMAENLIACGEKLGGREAVVVSVKPLQVEVKGFALRVRCKTRHIAEVLGDGEVPMPKEIILTRGFSDKNAQRKADCMTWVDERQMERLIGLLGEREQEPELLIAKPETTATIGSGGERKEGGEVHVYGPFEFWLKRDDYEDKTVYTFLLPDEW